jgi:peptidoglycan/xylan/chitin deacetylase (PgdA/CDA1 family)
MSLVTIVMYHYVREIEKSRFPAIKGLEVEGFHEQLDYMTRHYRFVTMQECMDSIASRKALPRNSALLTFDDGYLDHFLYAFPILAERKIQGCFFPPGRAISERRVLDVNKIHFVLANAKSVEALLEDVFALLDEHRVEFDLPSNESLFAQLGKPSRYDSKEVVFIKRLLQRELPPSLKTRIADRLFRKFVTSDETAFANELYMTPDQLKCMLNNGMYVGSHGWNHYWLDALTADEQEDEIDQSLQFLEGLGASTRDWTMCFPYGAYDEATLRILREKGCKVGLSTRVGIADLEKDDALTLPRLDTNDLPTDANAAPVDWTRKVAQ